MTATLQEDAVPLGDQVSLKNQLRRVERTSRLKTFGLTVPLLLFVLATFVLPIGIMLWRSVSNPVVAEVLPGTLAILEQWDGNDLPPPAAFDRLAEEMKAAQAGQMLGRVGTQLNYDKSGFKSLITKTQRRLAAAEAGPYQRLFTEIDAQWGEPETWRILKRVGRPLTPAFFVAAVDMRYAEDGSIVRQSEDRQIYTTLFARTFWVSLAVTILCAVLAYPVAYLMAMLPRRTANILMIFVLLPLWTSLLVRTTAWIVLLQTNGVVNDLLVWLGVIDDGSRLPMAYNMTGTIIAMTHILLPFMILPLYSVMTGISPTYVRAAQSLGARPFTAFWRVYAPQTVPGLSAGAILVFIMAIGYYITPALIGGRTGQLISNLIAFHMQSSLNWGLAAALGTVLLAGVLVLYLIYNRVVGIENMKLG